MNRRTALLLAPATALLAVGVLAGCGSSSSSTAPGGTTAPSFPAAESSPAAATSPAAPGAMALEIAVAGGKVTPAAADVPVPEGTPVTITITSDVADEVHLHGYDIEKELPAGGSATLEFTADQVGTFELETHESELLLAKLVVS